MLKKNYRKSLVLFVCLMLLFSSLILNHGAIKNLGLIDFSYESCYKYVLPQI